MAGHRSVLTVAAAVVLVAASAGCVADDSQPDAATTITVATTAPVTTADAVAALGATEVQVVARLPVQPMEWRTVELERETTGAWLISLAAVDGRFVATAVDWDPESGGQTVIQWKSADTITWEQTEMLLPDAWLNQVLPVGDRLVGLGTTANRFGPGAPRLWIDEGSGWQVRELGLPADPGSSLYLYGAAATDAGLVLAGDREPYEPVQSTILTTGGFRIEIDDNVGTYVVTDEATGRVVTSGPTSDIYRWSETGQILYDPTTGDVLTEVPWERWSDLYPQSSPLPLSVPADPLTSPPSLEYGGFRITIDDANGTFEIVRLDSGEVISGGLDELYRGPGPRFVDNQTGEIVLSLTWNEWDDLINRFWEARVEPHETHPTETVVLFSSDSVTWEAQTLNLAPNTHLEAVSAVDGRFVLTVVEHYDGGSNRMAWVSDDGQSWENIGTIGPESVSQVSAPPDGLAALGAGPGYPTVVASSDGLTWREELAIGVQSDGREAWLDLIGAGPFGTVVSGTVYSADASASLDITVGGRTARFGPDFAVQIIDDITGVVVLALTWDQIENADPGGAQPVTYADGATWFWDANGQQVLKIPDEDVYAAYDAQSQALDHQVNNVLFLKTPEGAWFEMTPAPVADQGSNQQLVVGDNAVIIGRTIWQPGQFDEAEPSSIQLLVGTPAL